MNKKLVDQVVNAVLYEGYILYPYRPSVKNRQRGTFGTLGPPAFCEVHPGADTCYMQTECLVSGDPNTQIEATVRFLHMTDRKIGAFHEPQTELEPGRELKMHFVDSIQSGKRLLQAWQEACERTIDVPHIRASDLLAQPVHREFEFSGQRQREPINANDGTISGTVIREQCTVRGTIDLTLTAVDDGLYRLTVRIANATEIAAPVEVDRDAALLCSLVSTHCVLGVAGGDFVSLFDPPDRWRAAAAACRNLGAWPVLVGAAGELDTMLSSPIILYDYPQIAPESMGDLFDGTEIDEILTLRILTLTDDEKLAMSSIDERAQSLLQRTESAARNQLMQLHGTLRDVRPLARGGDHG
jgi:hypothetical protein